MNKKKELAKYIKEIAEPVKCPNCSSKKVSKTEIVGIEAFQCLNCKHEFPDPKN